MIIQALIDLFNLLLDGLAAVAQLIINILPNSPFLLVESLAIPFVKQLNWIFPFDFMITVTSYWLSAILLYYAVQIVLRWVKAIE